MSQRKNEQEVPPEIVSDLLAYVQHHFCQEMSPSKWAKQKKLIKQNVILWPAFFIVNEHGFSLPAKRYQAIMRDVVLKAKLKAKKKVHWVAAYLGIVIQSHWRIHWPEYYAESKDINNQAQDVLMGFKRLKVLPGEAPDTTVDDMARAYSLLVDAKPVRVETPRANQPTFGF